MGKISELWQTLVHRWKNRMPKFFKWMSAVGVTMSGTAIAVQEALIHYNIEPDEWWTVAYKYLIGVGVGMAAASKFTQTYKDATPIDYDKEQNMED